MIVDDVTIVVRIITCTISELFTEVESRKKKQQSKENEVKNCYKCVDLMPNKFVILLLLGCLLSHADHF